MFANIGNLTSTVASPEKKLTFTNAHTFAAGKQ